VNQASLVTLGSVARELSVKATEGDAFPVYSVTKHAGFVPSLEFFTKQVFSRNTAGYKLVRRGQFAYATIHLDEGSLGLLTAAEAVLISPMYTVFEVDTTRVYPPYLYCALKSPQMISIYSRLGKGSVHRRKAISFERLAALSIPLPGVPEQRRIAHILDKADAIRRKRKDAIALTEELLRSVFLEMVGPGAPDYRNWAVRTIGSLAADRPNSMRTGPFGSDLLHSEFVDEGIAVLGIDNAVQNRFTWGDRRYITPEKYRKLRRYTVLPNDVIVTIMGTTGRSAVVPDDIPTAITTKHLATITLDRNEAEPEFVSQALFRHPEVLRQIAVANRGAIMSGLNLGLIKALRIPIPPPTRQREFARVTTRIRELTKRMENHGHEEELFNSLMSRAFSGQLNAVERTC
jgi:type I restriction enzyme, S subunit